MEKPRGLRVEVHHRDGRIEVVTTRVEGQRILDESTPGSVRVWLVWENDLGIAEELSASRGSGRRAGAAG